MKTRRSIHGSPVLRGLLGAIFLGVALLLISLAAHTLRSVRAMQAWPETPCTLLEAELKEGRRDNSTTYRVEARYSYEVDGRRYESTRVGLHAGGDSDERWHRDRYRLLQEAQAGQRMLTCRVNPAQPDEAILFPEARFGLLAFYLAIAVVFGGVGSFLLFGRKNRPVETGSPERPLERGEPWRQRPDWASGHIASANLDHARLMMLLAVVWNLLVWPAFAVQVGRMRSGEAGGPLMFLLPLLGLAFLAWALRERAVARRYGAAVFQMAAVPGVLGGRLAGLVRLPSAAQPESAYTLTVSCVRTRHSGKDRNRLTLWQETRSLDADAVPVSDAGPVLPVLFALPYDRPGSGERTDGGVVDWRLRVQGRQPGVDVDLIFEIPVYRTAESRPDFVLDEKPIAAYAQKT